MGKFIKDMPNADYHGYDGVSKSGLDKIARSPAHYKYSEYKPSTRAMVIGTAIHAAILEPERFDNDYLITEAKVRTAKEYRDAVKGKDGDYVLTAPEGKKVMAMRESVENNLNAMQHLRAPGDAELSAICTDPETGVTIRARFDWLTNSGISVDVKKTQDVRPGKFARSVVDYRYHVQDAMYSFIYKQVTGDDLQAFMFLAVEEEAPNSCQLYELDDVSKEMGAFYFRRDLRVYAECINSGKWPHPDNGDGELTLPNWVINQYENDIEVVI